MHHEMLTRSTIVKICCLSSRVVETRFANSNILIKTRFYNTTIMQLTSEWDVNTSWNDTEITSGAMEDFKCIFAIEANLYSFTHNVEHQCIQAFKMVLFDLPVVYPLKFITEKSESKLYMQPTSLLEIINPFHKTCSSIFVLNS